MASPAKPVTALAAPTVEEKPAAPKSVSSRSLGPKPAPVQPPDFDFDLEPSHQVTSDAVRAAGIQDRPGQMDIQFKAMTVVASVFLSTQADS